LAARGIDPEHSTEAWLAAIRDGSFPLDAFLRPRSCPQRKSRDMRVGSSMQPGVRHVPLPIPLALVLPDRLIRSFDDS